MIIGQFMLTFVTFAIPFLTNPSGNAYSVSVFGVRTFSDRRK